MDVKHIIEPERFGVWIAATFILALLALVLALVGINRNMDLTYITQGEVLLLNKKIEDIRAGGTAPKTETSEQKQQ